MAPAGGPGATAAAGAAWMLLAALMYTVTGAMVRHLAAGYSVFEVGFFRSVVAVAILLPLALRPARPGAGEPGAGPGGLRTRKLPLHALRTALAYVGIMCWFFAVSRIPLADYYALQFLTPLFTMAGAALLLGERTGWRHWLAALAGLAGAWTILRPGVAAVGAGALAAIGAALFFAATNWTVRVLARTDSARAIVTWGNLLLIPMSLIPALPSWVTPSWADLAWLCGVGVTGTAAQFAITRAVGVADARIVQPFDFARLPFAAALGWIVFGEAADPWTWAGAAVIFAAATWALRLERR